MLNSKIQYLLAINHLQCIIQGTSSQAQWESTYTSPHTLSKPIMSSFSRSIGKTTCSKYIKDCCITHCDLYDVTPAMQETYSL